MNLRVLVCGGRDFSDRDKLIATLDKFCDTFGLVSEKDEFGNYLPHGLTIVSGKARGADTMAIDWAIVNWVPFEEYPADWETHGRSAGVIRNVQMLATGIDVVIAFPGGRGTGHMVKIAKEKDVFVIEIP